MGRNYKKTNAETEGKKVSRQIVNLTIMQIANHLMEKHHDQLKNGHNALSITGLSLPSLFATQESDLQEDLKVFGNQLNSTIYGIEENKNTHAKAQKVIPKGMTMLPCMAFEKHLGEEGYKYTWVWFDSCGNAMNGEYKHESPLSQFVRSCKMITNPGVAFFTCRVLPRNMNAEEQYEILSGKKLSTVPYYKMIAAYKQIVKSELGDEYKIFSTVVYPTDGGQGYLMIGVAKGWNPREVHINLIEGTSYEDFVADMDYQLTLTHMSQITRSLKSLPKRFLANKNIRDQILDICPKMSERTTDYFEQQLNGMKQQLHEAFSLMQIAKKLIEPTTASRGKKPMEIPFDYVLERRGIMATKDFDYRSLEAWKSIGIEIGMTESFGYDKLRPRMLEYLEEIGKVDPYITKMNQRKAGVKAKETRLKKVRCSLIRNLRSMSTLTIFAKRVIKIKRLLK
jgi:hypothetical protein